MARRASGWPASRIRDCGHPDRGLRPWPPRSGGSGRSGHRDPRQHELRDLDVGALERRSVIDSTCPAAATQRASISVSSSASSASRSSRSSSQPGDLVLGGLDPCAGGRRLARPAGGPAELAEQAARRSAAAEQPAEDRAGRRQQVVAARERPAGRLGDLGGVARRRRSAPAAWSPWPRTCRAAWRLGVGPFAGDRPAAGGEVVGALAGPAVQLQLAVGRQLDASGCGRGGRRGRAGTCFQNDAALDRRVGEPVDGDRLGAASRRSRSS